MKQSMVLLKLQCMMPWSSDSLKYFQFYHCVWFSCDIKHQNSDLNLHSTLPCFKTCTLSESKQQPISIENDLCLWSVPYEDLGLKWMHAFRYSVICIICFSLIIFFTWIIIEKSDWGKWKLWDAILYEISIKNPNLIEMLHLPIPTGKNLV